MNAPYVPGPVAVLDMARGGLLHPQFIGAKPQVLLPAEIQLRPQSSQQPTV